MSWFRRYDLKLLSGLILWSAFMLPQVSCLSCIDSEHSLNFQKALSDFKRGRVCVTPTYHLLLYIHATMHKKCWEGHIIVHVICSCCCLRFNLVELGPARDLLAIFLLSAVGPSQKAPTVQTSFSLPLQTFDPVPKSSANATWWARKSEFLCIVTTTIVSELDDVSWSLSSRFLPRIKMLIIVVFQHRL